MKYPSHFGSPQKIRQEIITLAQYFTEYRTSERDFSYERKCLDDLSKALLLSIAFEKLEKFRFINNLYYHGVIK